MGSIITDGKSRSYGKSYSKTSSKPRPNFREPYQETTKWVSGNVHGDVHETTSRTMATNDPNTKDFRYPGGKREITDRFYTPHTTRTQGGRDIPKDVWKREKYWGTYSETKRLK